ncbi:helix-turn-helix transcriptional regulator [Cognatilysobacter lacus]|uniref:YafY family transcriptional regulator n=1 Tax=Cognatilysobacter lacus TaxID=1643323 RepID=A0A5D8Z5R6_9GAMM|nr:YafY family protein [Lysobacter lacus]TZF89856.1 YafY family transcriptional regulator [Lysobacter lacus]
MRRADRLFLLVNALRGRRRAVLARDLASTLGVSMRTVYRDVADLQRSGIPIEGEAGVGYVLRHGAEIPPLMFDADEIEAVVVGIRFARAFAGNRVSEGAARAMVKIEAAIPERIRALGERTAILAPDSRGESTREFGVLLDTLNEAIAARRVLRLVYRDAGDASTTRDVEPLCIVFWGGSWTLGGWCQLRAGFRQFRLNRIDAMQPTGDIAEERAERSLASLLREVRGRTVAPSPEARVSPPVALV